MAVYKTRWFDRWARKQGLTTLSLCVAVRELRAGLYDADLGGGLLKADCTDRTGKRSGFRTLVATNKRSRWIFVFGFPKNEHSNIDKDEEDALKHLAAHLLALTAQALDQAERAGELMEVHCDAKNQINHS